MYSYIKIKQVILNSLIYNLYKEHSKITEFTHNLKESDIKL